MNRKRTKQSFLESFKVANRGILFGIVSQRNMRTHLVFGILVIGLGLFLKLTRIEWALLTLSISFVIFAELVNTSIEISIDLVTKQQKIRAMLSKDIAAGAVLVASLNALVVGYLIFYPRLCNVMGGFIGRFL